MYDFLVVNGQEVHDIINHDYKRVIDNISNTYVNHYKGETINPNTYSLKFPQKSNARINALPAYVGADVNLAGIKWISSFPDNINRGIPRASAVLLLNDFATGYPIACLEGSIISAARTAASAVAGALVLNSGKNIKKISFIGAGVIARYIFDFFIASRSTFEEINLYDTNSDYAESFSRYIKGTLPNKKVSINTSLSEACSGSDIVVLATTANAPYIHDKNIFKNDSLILNISLRDISPEIVNDSVNVVDDVNHCLNAATSTHLAYIKYGNHNFIHATIGELLANKSKVIDRSQQLTIYSPFGMGMLDVALGSYVYNMARKTNKGTLINNFFYEQKRW